MPNYNYDGFKEVVMTSQSAPLQGQNNRSSGNYLFTGEAFRPCSQVIWECDSGITFDVKQDHASAADKTLHKSLCNGSVTTNPGVNGVYIANPQGARGEFSIRVKVYR